MAAPAPRVASASSWLMTSTYAYFTFVTSTRLATTAMRWAAALIVASVAYVLVMLALAAVWRHDPDHAAIGCAGSMAVAVICGAWAASAILLPRHHRIGVWAWMILGIFYPVLLAAGSAPGTPVRTMQFLYVVASAAGGIAALWTLPVSRRIPGAHAARA